MSNSPSQDCVYLLSEQTDSPLYTSWLGGLEMRYEFVEQYDESWQPPADAAIVVTHQHYRLKEAAILLRLVKSNSVPVLAIADGILEYRNSFEHPQVAFGAVFQPLLAHKLACIGRSQARVVESWNSDGCCEVVGLPQLDEMPIPSGLKQASDRSPDDFRVLIASARQPAFTREHMLLVREGFSDLKRWFDSHPMFRSRKLIPVWRLTGDLDNQLMLDPSTSNISTQELSDELATVDAVITTPSTLALEAMRFNVPVAMLDYTNSPHYVSAAWNIRSATHINSVLRELAIPPPAKLMFQQITLFDALECRSPAAPRMCKLVQRMIDAANGMSSSNEPIQLPSRLLAADDYAVEIAPQPIKVDDLHSHVPLISYDSNSDAVLIAAHQRAEIERLQEKIADMNLAVQEAARMRRQLEQAMESYELKRSKLTRINRLLSPRTVWFSRVQSDRLVIANLNEWLSFCEHRDKISCQIFPQKVSKAIRISPIQKPSGVLRLLRKTKRNCRENYRRRARIALQYATTNYWSPPHRKIYWPPAI